MAELMNWDVVLSTGLPLMFSPSGQALAIHPLLPITRLETIEIHFSHGGPPIVYESDDLITPLAWASDIEFIFWKWEENAAETEPILHVLSIEDGKSRVIAKREGSRSMTWMGIPGHLCVLTELEGKERLFDLEVGTGTFERMVEFDKALDQLEVYPLFRHAWSQNRQEVALIAWPYDYLEEGVEPTKMNSQWLPILDEAAKRYPDAVLIRRDGSTMTQREFIQEARRNKAYRLFLLNTAGEYIEVPETYKAHDPVWSPDGSILAFNRHEESGEGLWLMRRSDLSLRRIGSCLPASQHIMHPSGVLFCQLTDENISDTREHKREDIRSNKWYRLGLSNGELHSVERQG